MRTFIAIALGLSACTSGHQRLRYESLRSQALSADMDVGVYTPPGWQDTERLPVVLFLHAAGDDARAFDDSRFALELDSTHRMQLIPRAVVVVPSGGVGMWVNWFDGSRDYQDWVVEEVMPHVAETYNTLPCPEHCHVMGVAMGGFGAQMLAMERPDRFSSAASVSGPVFDSEQLARLDDNPLPNLFLKLGRVFGPEPSPRRDPFVRWRKASDLRGVRLFVAWGRGEVGISAGNQRLIAHFVEHDIPFEAHVFKGGHDWASRTDTLLKALRFHVWGNPRAAGPP